METADHCVVEAAGLSCGVTIYAPHDEGCARRGALLYLHGGGLLYGERDDLPRPYVDLFLERGYSIVCADYPLAPEAALATIETSVDALWQWFSREFAPKHDILEDALFLFGRSAGAYLALTLAGRLIKETDAANRAPGTMSAARRAQPSGIVDLYGFGSLDAPFLSEPSAYYQSLPAVSKTTAEGLMLPSPITSGAKEKRFSLYVYARQRGLWRDLLGVGPSETAPHALTDAQVKRMPPVFYAASTGDQDVPYAISKALARRLRARMVTVYSLPHDFDRDLTNPAGMDVYRQCVAWMDGLLAKCATQ